MITTLSCILRDPDILPTISGMHSVYDYTKRLVQEAKGLSSVALLSVALGLEISDLVISDKNTFIHNSCQELQHFDLLSRPMELFSGSGYHARYVPKRGLPSRERLCTAIVEGGICYYLDCLETVSARPETARFVHVLPGHIQMDDKQFTSIFDPHFGPHSAFLNLSPVEYQILDDSIPVAVDKQREQLPLYFPSPTPWPTTIGFRVCALENSEETQLVIYLDFAIPGEPSATLQLGRLTYKLLKRTGLVPCNPSRCDQRYAMPCAQVQSGWRSEDINIYVHSSQESTCLVWPRLSDMACCVIINGASEKQLFIRRGECLSCCTTSILRLGPDAQAVANEGKGFCKFYHIL